MLLILIIQVTIVKAAILTFKIIITHIQVAATSIIAIALTLSRSQSALLAATIEAINTIAAGAILAQANTRQAQNSAVQPLTIQAAAHNNRNKILLLQVEKAVKPQSIQAAIAEALRIIRAAAARATAQTNF